MFFMRTQSSRESIEEPSTPNQLLLAEELVTELKSSGLQDAHIGKGGVVYGTLPATPGCEDCPGLGLIAHMDTSPDAPAVNIKPQILVYEGKDVLLNPEKEIYFKEESFPEIKKYLNQGNHFLPTAQPCWALTIKPELQRLLLAWIISKLIRKFRMQKSA